jgi:hypothetical protein
VDSVEGKWFGAELVRQVSGALGGAIRDEGDPRAA